jgi:hypothetical protein
MATSHRPPDPLARLRRRGRRAGLVIFGLLVAAVTAWWSGQILQQVFAPTAAAEIPSCRTGLLDLLAGVNRAREAAAAEVTGEKAALEAFRQALEPSWKTRPGLDVACLGDGTALQALREIDDLRYAEEHAVRYEAVRLARQRKRARAIAEQFGAPPNSP